MDTLEQVRKAVAGVLKISVEELDADAEMEDVENWDSMRNIMILSALEEQFDIVFPEDDIFDLTSVRALAQEIDKLKA